LDGERRKHAIICLKLGQVDEYSHRAIYRPRHLVEELTGALKVLRTDYVDICLIHAPTLLQVREGRALAVVQTIQAMGAARYVGYSFEAEPEHANLALTQDIDVMMFQYNLIDKQCEGLFDLASERGVGVLVGGPFKRGYLTGRYDKPEDLPVEDNYWDWNLRYCRERVIEVLGRAVALKAEAGGARELRRMALGQVLKHSGAVSAIVGHRTEDEVSDNVSVLRELADILCPV
jgi:aryl-alcohol dehydrogenase-like predicted oxidoreductase